MEFPRFLGRHVLASLLGAAGVTLAALGYADQARDILTAFEPWQLQGAGAALFVISVVMILYKWDQEHQRRLSQPQTGAPAPEAVREPSPPTLLSASVPAPAPRGAAVESGGPSLVRGDKVIVGDKVTANFLMDACVNKTDVHSAGVIRPYLGKWLRIHGRVNNISPREDGTSYVSLDVPYPFRGSELSRTVWLSFPGDRERLEVMHKGDPVSAIGKIMRVRSATMDLEDCELVD